MYIKMRVLETCPEKHVLVLNVRMPNKQLMVAKLGWQNAMATSSCFGRAHPGTHANSTMWRWKQKWAPCARVDNVCGSGRAAKMKRHGDSGGAHNLQPFDCRQLATRDFLRCKAVATHHEIQVTHRHWAPTEDRYHTLYSNASQTHVHVVYTRP